MKMIKEPINKKIEEEPVHKEVESCPICYEEMGECDICITKCGHKFCMPCLFRHTEQSVDCPMCRRKIVDVKEKNYSREPSFSNEEILDMVNEDMSIEVDYMDQLLRSTTLPQINYTGSENTVTTTDSGLEIIYSENAFPAFNLDSSRRQVESLVSFINEDGCYDNTTNNYIDLTIDDTISSNIQGSA